MCLRWVEGLFLLLGWVHGERLSPGSSKSNSWTGPLCQKFWRKTSTRRSVVLYTCRATAAKELLPQHGLSLPRGAARRRVYAFSGVAPVRVQTTVGLFTVSSPLAQYVYGLCKFRGWYGLSVAPCCRPGPRFAVANMFSDLLGTCFVCAVGCLPLPALGLQCHR